MGPVDNTEVLGSDEVFRDSDVRVPMLHRRVMDVATKHADGMCKIWSCPYCEVNQLAVRLEDPRLEFSVDLRRAICFGVSYSGVERCAYAS